MRLVKKLVYPVLQPRNTTCTGPKPDTNSKPLFAGGVHVITPSGTVITSAQLPRGAVPAFLAVGGFLDADWRISVACREGRVYTVKVSE